MIIITGPTGVGKTAAAIAIAQHYSTEIISADSRQCFKELNIGVARPSPEELQQVPHWFIASHSVTDDVNAIVFEQYALQKATELFQNHDIVVMAGGTGLYIKAFCEGMDEMPAVDPAIRSGIAKNFEEQGITWLHEETKQKDPAFYQTGEIQNPQRLMRALEIMEATGQSILHFRKGNKTKRDFDIIKIGLELPKEELHSNINTRVDKMIEAGLVNEVQQLQVYKQLNALQTVGYTEVFDFLDNKISLQQATDAIKQNTRQYAKRQMTWFRKDKDLVWFSPQDLQKIKEYLHSTLSL